MVKEAAAVVVLVVLVVAAAVVATPTKKKRPSTANKSPVTCKSLVRWETNTMVTYKSWFLRRIFCSASQTDFKDLPSDACWKTCLNELSSR